MPNACLGTRARSGSSIEIFWAVIWQIVQLKLLCTIRPVHKRGSIICVRKFIELIHMSNKKLLCVLSDMKYFTLCNVGSQLSLAYWLHEGQLMTMSLTQDFPIVCSETYHMREKGR